MKSITRMLMTAIAGLILLASHARAADAVTTIITIPDMDCASCAKKVGTKVAEVPGVAKVEYNVEGRIIKVTAKEGTTLSPKALWEGVVKGGKEPSKLEGPSGKFAAKPNS